MSRNKAMKRLWALGALLFSACGDGASPEVDAGNASDAALPIGVYLDVQYSVRCDGSGSCTPVVRDINGFDGTDDLRLTCTVVETATQRTLSFSGLVGTDWGISVSGAVFARAGGSPAASGCVATVVEGGGSYSGPCGPEAPSAAQPCQIEALVFTEEAETGSSLITGRMRCAGLPSATTPADLRDVTGPSGAGTSLMFNVYDCAGYEPD